jgi:hypothetical protein
VASDIPNLKRHILVVIVIEGFRCKVDANRQPILMHQENGGFRVSKAS